jgi:hypothetical protein
VTVPFCVTLHRCLVRALKIARHGGKSHNTRTQSDIENLTKHSQKSGTSQKPHEIDADKRILCFSRVKKPVSNQFTYSRNLRASMRRGKKLKNVCPTSNRSICLLTLQDMQRTIFETTRSRHDIPLLMDSENGPGHWPSCGGYSM